METMVHFDVEETNGVYYINILGSRIGKGFKDKNVAGVVLRWLNGALQDLIDVYSKIVDKAFKESEK